MAEEKDRGPSTGEAPEGSASPFPELDEIEREVQKRLRDNHRFLEHFLDEDFDDDDEDENEEEENFEEL